MECPFVAMPPIPCAQPGDNKRPSQGPGRNPGQVRSWPAGRGPHVPSSGPGQGEPLAVEGNRDMSEAGRTVMFPSAVRSGRGVPGGGPKEILPGPPCALAGERSCRKEIQGVEEGAQCWGDVCVEWTRERS